MAAENDSVIARLRGIADELETQMTELVRPDVSVAEAVRRLRQSFRKGKLTVEIFWSDYKVPPEIEYSVHGSGYSAIATDNGLSNVIRKALVANSPNDTLDKLDAAMGPPVGEVSAG